MSGAEVGALFNPIFNSGNNTHDCTGETPYLSGSTGSLYRCLACWTAGICGGDMCSHVSGTCEDVAWYKNTSEEIQIENETGNSMCLREGFAGCVSAEGVTLKCGADVEDWDYSSTEIIYGDYSGALSPEQARIQSCETTFIMGSAKCQGTAPNIALTGNNGVPYPDYSSLPYYVSDNGNPGDMTCSMAGFGSCIKAYDHEGQEMNCANCCAHVAVCN